MYIYLYHLILKISFYFLFIYCYKYQSNMYHLHLIFNLKLFGILNFILFFNLCINFLNFRNFEIFFLKKDNRLKAYLKLIQGLFIACQFLIYLQKKNLMLIYNFYYYQYFHQQYYIYNHLINIIYDQNQFCKFMNFNYYYLYFTFNIFIF